MRQETGWRDRTSHHCLGYAAKRKLVMMSPQRIHLQQVKDLPMRNAMKARMMMFKLSSTWTTANE